MNDIFKNAYFGKPYKTRDGRKAIFIVDMGNYNFPYRLVIDGNDSFSNYNEYGRMYSTELPNDIVSEWQEEINEEKLDKLANNEYPDDDDDDVSLYGIDRTDQREAFKTGYRKAMKKYNK